MLRHVLLMGLCRRNHWCVPPVAIELPLLLVAVEGGEIVPLAVRMILGMVMTLTDAVPLCGGKGALFFACVLTTVPPG